MTPEKPGRRMSLRQLLSNTEKLGRDLIEHMQSGLLTQLNDFRDLSRPVRRRSHYPKMVAVQNSLRKLAQASDQALAMADQLHEHLEEIREHSRRERVNRL